MHADPTSTDLSNTVVLCVRAQQGDQRAFATLYYRYHAQVRQSAAAKMRKPLRQCEHDIDDVLQETFADVFRRIAQNTIPELSSDGALRNYLAKAVVNRIISRRRQEDAVKRGGGKVQVMSDHGPQTTSSFSPPHEGPTPSQCAGAKEAEQRIEEALLQLPDHYQAVIDLVANCGMTPAEIATKKLLPKATKPESVRFVLHRARRALEQKMRELGGVEQPDDDPT